MLRFWSRWLNTVSLELLFVFTVHVNIFIRKRYAGDIKLLKKKVRQKAEKKMLRSFAGEIYSVLVTFYILRDLSKRTSVELAYLGSNLSAACLLTLIGNVWTNNNILKSAH